MPHQYDTEKQDELYSLYTESVKESKLWRKDYHEYERLADNDLIEDLDESLPEVNDGSLAASLFKLPKRIVNSKLKGRVRATNRDDAWLTELANMQWENEILPNANSQAPFHRKWKDAVRKAAIYGSVPLITLFVKKGNYTGSDFIVAQPQDVTLEAGKVSDYDSDVIWWDIYLSDIQMEKLIDQAKEETAEQTKTNESGYNKWDVEELESIYASKQKDDRDAQSDHRQKGDKAVVRGGYHFCITFQRGVDSEFIMYSKKTKKAVRRWTNPDPTGDIPVHFLYCYQDFINPYGIGIVKLAGGTQNVLDYFRQADVLATQLGFRPPVSIGGDVDSADLDSIIYAQDQQWIIGNATVRREEISNQIYGQLPNRISMYKVSLNQLIPVGDTSIAAGSGDADYSKTPAGVKFQQASLSIDDEDFKDNLDMTYEAVVKSMINTHFANMQGTDLMKLSDEERDILTQSGVEFPVNEEGNATNELEIVWDKARGQFDFEIDATQDKTTDDAKRLEGLLKVAEFRATDPMFDQKLSMSGMKINDGEMYKEIIALTTDNDKILEEITPEDQEAQEAEQAAQMGIDPATGQPIEPPMEQGQEMPQEVMEDPNAMTEEEMQAGATIQAVMEQYDIDENTAAAMLEAEKQGHEPQAILDHLNRVRNGQ